MPRNRHLGALLAAVAVLETGAGCARPSTTPATEMADTTDGLKRALAQIPGVYTWNSDLSLWQYSAAAELESVLASSPSEGAVGALIACLDDSSPSASTLDGQALALGIVCYQGLSQLVYYEPTDADGDVAADWPGHLTPRASQEEMKGARVAWERAHESKLLILQ